MVISTLTTRASTVTRVDGWRQTLLAELQPLVLARVAWAMSMSMLGEVV